MARKASKKNQLKKVLTILKSSFRSERADDYRDYNEDYQWGPALGAAANAGKDFNKDLEKLILFVKEEIKKAK